MAEEKVRFMFALSAEGTKKLEKGELELSSGGLRRKDGSLFEMATPICLDPASVPRYSKQTVESALRRQLEMNNFWLDQTMQDVNALKEIAWMNYAVNCRTYEMTFQGFERLIGQMEDFSAHMTRIERKIDNKEFNDRLELANKYQNKLKSIAGYMDAKNFNASSAFLNIAETLDEIEAYFERLHNELKTGTGNDQIVLASVFFLIGPYVYVVRRFSALYYYESDSYPPNYQKWVESISNFVRDSRVKDKVQYFLRLNTECSLEDVFKEQDKLTFNLRGFIRQINFDHAYVLQHSKEEYLSIGRQLQEKYEQEEYEFVEGHLCIEI